MSTIPISCCSSFDSLHVDFLALLPRIETHARISFRSERCSSRRADLIAETVAIAWRWYRSLIERGKDPARFPTALATLAARAVRCGRRIAGAAKAKDVLNDIAQRRHGFTVSKLPDFSTLTSNPLADALRDNRCTPPPDAAAFRCDWPHWLTTRTERDRRIITDMAVGERTLDVSRKFGLSPARVSQLRRQFKKDWSRFVGDA
jgi:hypothetical protein